MEEIVASVSRVSDLIGEVTASSIEQRDGTAQVNQAVNAPRSDDSAEFSAG